MNHAVQAIIGMRWMVTTLAMLLLAGSGCSQEPHSAQSQQPKPTPTASAQAPVDSDKLERRRQGAELFSRACTSCHGRAGNGRGSRKGPSLQRPELTYGNTQEAIIESIRDGRPGGMPAYGQVFDQSQLEALSLYILSLKQ